MSTSRTLPFTTSKVISIYIGMYIIWAMYRAFFHTSLWIEEIVIKGAIFMLPLIVLPLGKKEPLRALGITTTNFFKSASIGIGVGVALGLAGASLNLIRYQTLLPASISGIITGQIGAYIILAIITAFWEQLAFSGYFLTQLITTTNNEITAVSLTGILFSLIHLPAYLFLHHQSLPALIINLVLLVMLGAGCAILQLRTKNLIAPIMAHVMWGVMLFLFY